MYGLIFGVYYVLVIVVVNEWFFGWVQVCGQVLYFSLLFGVGGLFGVLISGWMWDDWGVGWMFVFSLVFVLVGFFLVWCWVFEFVVVDGFSEVKMIYFVL